MKKSIFSMAIIAILFVSCQTEKQDVIEDGVPAPEIIASVETNSATRTLISVDEEGEGRIYWTPADQINIFYGTTSTLYTSQNTVNATTAVFRTTDIIGSTESASTNIWGLYPYDEDATCSGTAVTTTLPATQYGVPETFDDDLYITLAHSATNALKFFNVCGGIKFSLSRADITAITFKGNNNEDIAGDISLTFQNDLPKATVVNGLKEVTLTPKTGTTFAKDVNYYLILLPGTLSGGFTMTFTTTGGAVGTFNYTTNAITIKRSIFSKKADIDTYATFQNVPSVPVPEAVDLGLSVKWASFNLGASNPEEFGDYYAWGEVAPKERYSWSNYVLGSSNSSLSKYNSVDGNLVLDVEDDAATQLFGGNWRMPNREEMDELYDNCNRAFTTVNGINGFRFTSKVSGFETASIFLPCTEPERANRGYYWSASLYPNGQYSGGFVFDLDGATFMQVYRTALPRYVGASIRPVYGERISVSGISLNESSISLYTGQIFSLSATVTPSNAYNKSIVWSIDDPSIANVDYLGNVTAISSGTTILTATTVDGSFTDDCILTVTDSFSSQTYVDLGLSVKWATCNLGASTPEEHGNYFAWGETQSKNNYSANTYLYDSSPLTLPTQNDAASIILGGTWRIPTAQEWRELADPSNCTWSLDDSGDYYRVVSTKNGKEIIFPLWSNFKSDSYLYSDLGMYWTASIDQENTNRALIFQMNSKSISVSMRYLGLTVRPVCD